MADYWDDVLARWVDGDRDLPFELRRWLASYSGKGDGAVDLSVFPEPYIGRMVGAPPALVMLGLNPRRPSARLPREGRDLHGDDSSDVVP